MKTTISKVYILLVAFVFFSCNSNVVYDENKEVDSQVWKTTDKLYYEK